jgi:pullulanase-type alpha-1,6-glucosidase
MGATLMNIFYSGGRWRSHYLRLLILLALILTALGPTLESPTRADDLPQPKMVALVGTLAAALGCASDAQADCDKAQFNFNTANDLWQATFEVPAGEHEYRVALDGSADKTFGAGGTAGGAALKLTIAEKRPVAFVFNLRTGYVADNVNRIFANIPGSHQASLGCPGDWQPDCLRTLLEDPDGDGTYQFTTKAIPAGDYEAKVAVNGSWAENYGGNGARDGANISFNVPTNGVNIIFVWDSASKIMDITVEGAPKGNLKQAKAHWVSRDTIAWPSRAITPDATFALHYDLAGGMKLELEGLTGGTAIPLTYDVGGLSAASKAKFPHLANATALKLPESATTVENVREMLKGQLVVTATGADGKIIDSTALQIPGVLDDLYTYDGQLGVSFEGDVPTIRVWAPTAQVLNLNVFDDPRPNSDPALSLPMTLDAATGVWSIKGDASWKGKWYLYDVTVWVRTSGNVERNQVTDPYSVNLSADGLRSQIVDLSDAALKPEGWDALQKPAFTAFEDIVIYELHVRDFSIFDESVPAEHRGKFLAFTNPATNGMKHLITLAKAGITHLHLLPAFDFATTRERDADRQEPPLPRLRRAEPDSELQQQLVERSSSRDGFNWGYDPHHFNAPEGSYATNPDGPSRIVEFRGMVKSLNENGMRVVMDVVYNHTNASGQNAKSVFDRIVPGYYHRLNGDGAVERSTCCENTASEHAMMDKFMVDSIVLWATQYKVDAFRFDLMGHHMVVNMQKIRAALDALTLEKDGVDGKSIYLYGEGWNFGEVANNQRGVNATQANLTGTGIGTFSDRLRDGVRGGGPFDPPLMQGFASGLAGEPNGSEQGTPEEQRARLLSYQEWIRLGLAGNLSGYKLVNAKGETVTGAEIDYKGQKAGYTLDPQEQIVYVSKHDNETIFDVLALKLPTALPLADRIRMHNLGLSTALLSQGVVFIHAGDDVLRSKSMDRDSYNSGDWFNFIDWTFTDNGWGRGLPIADKNKDKWPLMQPLLANPALKPTQQDALAATAVFQDFLRIRKSSPLFRLQTAEQIMARVSFLNTGAAEIPGVVVYVLDDSEAETLDSAHSKIVVVFNATPTAQTISDPALAGLALELHPIQAEGSDAVVKAATAADGTLTIPARTTAVFVVKR